MKILRIAAALILLVIAALLMFPFFSEKEDKSEYKSNTLTNVDVIDSNTDVVITAVLRDTVISCNSMTSRETTDEPQNLETKINETPDTTNIIDEETSITLSYSEIDLSGNFNENTIELEEESFYSSTIKVIVNASQKEKIDNLLSQYTEELKMLAKLIYTEAGTVYSDSHKAAVVWCVLNRVDNPKFGKTIKSVITAPHQFAYRSSTKIYDRLLDLATDVVTRWLLEKEGFTDVGRVLPSSYLFFDAAGPGGNDNRFREDYYDRVYWDWSLESPYLHE